MKYQGIFVTGTDTGVGKTVVSAALLSVLCSHGVDAVPMKPVQTGATRRCNRWRSPDLDFCLAMAGLKPFPLEYARMAPCCFAKACSPHLAAAVAGRRIGFRRINACLSSLQARHATVIVEGAGGVCVPIRGRQTMLDLMGALDLPVVLVARLGLGTINHTLLSLHDLRRAQVRVLGVVFNATAPGRSDYIERDNIKTITRLGTVRVLGRLPFIPNLATLSAGQFRRAVAVCLPPAAAWLAWLKFS
ncbi:MAG: dethiobiotin synthase [Verrucomicrobia bacterium]|nr:dethiobiotin synthase [Verrucomicrobiota bacterium]MBU1735999.1 dethiobiotin synthase [Verrucomicrobiota bacterium]MBU1856285.1 dethiobiotin synthase [Verrucomicrobiota bacterium]